MSCPEHEFPELPEEAECPLCQKILGQDGVARLIRFDAFVKQAAERAASDAREVAETAYRAVQQAVVDLMFRDDLVEELTEVDPTVATECSLMQQSLDDRKKSAIRAAASEIPWQEVTKLSTDPQNNLQKIIDGLHEQAKMLDITVDESARIAMLAEELELSARVRLGEIKGAVLESIAKHEVARKLQRCIDRLDTRVISRKSTELSRTIASQELADALNDELKSLKVHEIHVVMKPESPGGKTKYKLVLQLPGGGTPAAILSEGEQRAIAIASFLAEIKLGKGRGGVVFDDPVSSLDHRRRWEVAERLAIEAKTRQVIVFTHDIYFLCILEQKTDELGTELRKSYIRRTPQGYGVHSQDLPFDLLSTKDRVASLRQMVLRIREARNEGNEDEQRSLTSRCYGRLRLAWERGIEEVLLYGTVQRFGEGVSTQRLKSVVVTDEDYREIDVGMSKSSKFEHDAAMAVGRLPVPDPDELEQDIESLSKWRKLVEARRDSIRKTRG